MGPPRGGYGPPTAGLGPPITHPAPAAAASQAGATNHVGTITMVCRAISLSSVDPAADSDIAYAFESQLQASPYFNSQATQLTGQINAENAAGTFTFGVTAVLKKPLKLNSNL